MASAVCILVLTLARRHTRDVWRKTARQPASHFGKGNVRGMQWVTECPVIPCCGPVDSDSRIRSCNYGVLPAPHSRHNRTRFFLTPFCPSRLPTFHSGITWRDFKFHSKSDGCMSVVPTPGSTDLFRVCFEMRTTLSCVCKSTRPCHSALMR